MRYLSAPIIEQYEEQLLPAEVGLPYFPGGHVTLCDSALLETPKLDNVELDGECLFIHPESVSWAFLTRNEADFLSQLSPGKRYAWLVQRWPKGPEDSLDMFVSRLFRRGLITINGETSIQPDIFHDSHNVPREGHLVELLLTEKCNLGCGYCLAGASPKMPHMNPDIARKTIDLAFAMNEAPSVTFEFSGGEPFLRFDLMQELVQYIHEHPCRNDRYVHICVQTNGTLLTSERVDWLKSNDIQVGLSLDGNPESHNMSRPQLNGEESFSKVLTGLDFLQRAGISVGVLVVLNRSNVHSAQELIDFLVENGINSVKLNPIAFLGSARQTWDGLGLTQEEVIGYFQAFARLLVDHDYDIIEANMHDMLRHLVSKQRHSRCLRGHCGAGETFQAIAANGDIYPCGRSTQTPALVLGNVLTESGSLSSPGRRNQHVQQIKMRRPETLDGCVTCSYRELCQAGCSAEAFERYGTVRHRTPECTFFKTMYPYLMRWLCFDGKAVAHFNRSGYFGSGQRNLNLVVHDFLPN